MGLFDEIEAKINENLALTPQMERGLDDDTGEEVELLVYQVVAALNVKNLPDDFLREMVAQLREDLRECHERLEETVKLYRENHNVSE